MMWTRLLALLLAALLPAPALAAGCFPIASGPARAWPASLERADLPQGATVQVTFLGHASFLIETPAGVTAVTDYNDYVRPPLTPRIATMNNAHDTHFSGDPDPGIELVLRGWNPEGGPAEHDVTVGDLRVRNVPTAVHGRVGAQALGNSIFVFEVGDLCIAHLGHLHHLLTRGQLAELGLIDILMVPVDGSYTMSREEMLQVVGQIRPSVVIPMHYFNAATLADFLARIEGSWRIVRSETPTVSFSRATLPRRVVLVLPGG